MKDEICATTKNHASKKFLSAKFWKRIHICFFHHSGYTFLILLESYSKFIDVHIISDTGAQATVESWKSHFVFVGYQISFVKFCQSNGITQIKSPPYHSQSNGSAQRGVQTVQKALLNQVMSKSKEKQLSLSQRLSFSIGVSYYSHRVDTV